MAVKVVKKRSWKAPAAPDSEAKAKAPMGLGDAVEVVAKPIAKALGIKDCTPCQHRKEMLNAVSARARAGVRRIFGG